MTDPDDHMADVGVRELERLSRYLDRVERGELLDERDAAAAKSAFLGRSAAFRIVARS
jgi:hypothetical protein